jgi:hypothetical protein
MASLVYPLILEKMIKNNEIDPPFVRLTPKTKTYKLEKGEPIEDTVINGTTITKDKVNISTKQTESDSIGFTEDDNVIKSIILPMPPSVTDNLSGNFQSVEGLGMLSRGLGEYIKWKGYKILGSLGGMLPQEVVAGIKSGLFGGGIDNPHDKLLYAGHNRRSFDLNYEKMLPTSREEEEVMRRIINIFRMSSIGNYSREVIQAPISWDVEFHSSIDNVILRYVDCQISSNNSTWGGDSESFERMESGYPVPGINITMNEMNYIFDKQRLITDKGIQ